VRAGLERPDVITNSAATAREEIGRAIAAQIRELKTGKDLEHVAEDVLPKIEKFLESPEEKRLRRMREGVITTAVGLSAMVMFLLAAIFSRKEEWLMGSGLASAIFLIGLGIIINGKLLTVQKKQVSDRKLEAAVQSELDKLPGGATAQRRELTPSSNPPLSVIEHTTHRLSNEPVGARSRPSSGQE
jgi:hypothetical protein